MTTPAPEDIAGEFVGAETELKAAKVLLEKGLMAQAVSSAYYAVFHATRALLWSRGKNAKTHRGIAQLFGEEFIRTGELDELYANVLTGHREKREMADYDPVDFNVTSAETKKILEDAEKFVEKAGELLPA